MQTLATTIKKKRLDMHLSLREAAQLIGISHTYLKNLESGIDPRSGTGNNPTPETLKLLSTAYNINYYELLVLCGYNPRDDGSKAITDNLNIQELISISKKLSNEELAHLTRYAKFMFSEAFLVNRQNSND